MVSRIRSAIRLALLTSALTLGLALSSALADKVYNFPKDKPIFTISYPDSWNEIASDDEYVEYGVKDEVSLGAWILKDKTDLKEAATAAGEEIATYVKEFKVDGEATTLKINGMDMILVTGKGKDKETGKELEVQVGFFSPDSKTICALLYYGVVGTGAKYGNDVEKILKSVKAK
ncbi:MAG: hypothetical protein ACAI35_22995 [Candidatus Methylacidiphilales bacterium]|nr:hypothetical protein [Candidatus Methylacidiphilales bacterium]